MFIKIGRNNFNKLSYCNSYIGLNILYSFFTHIVSFFTIYVIQIRNLMESVNYTRFSIHIKTTLVQRDSRKREKTELLFCSALISSNKHSYVKPFHFSFYDICNFSPFTLLTKVAPNGAKANMKPHSIIYTYVISRDFFLKIFHFMDLLSVNLSKKIS